MIDQKVESGLLNRFRILIGIIMLISFNRTVCYAGNHHETGFWICGGAGPVILDRKVGFGGVAGVHYNSAWGLFGIRYAVSEISGMEPGETTSPKIESLTEYSATWGLIRKWKRIRLSASGGLAFVRSDYRIPGGKKEELNIGIPLDLEISLRILPVYCVGLAYAPVFTSDVNTHRMLLVLHFGKVWN